MTTESVEPAGSGPMPSPAEEARARVTSAEDVASLLRVTTPDDARAALAAARDVSVVPPNRVGWLALARAIWLPAGLLLGVAVGMLLRDGETPDWFLLVTGAAMLSSVASLRLTGVDSPADVPPPSKLSRAGGAATVAAVLAVVAATWRLDVPLGAWVGVGLGAAALTVVTWVRTRRRLAASLRPPVTWPPGSEAFALLSILDQADRLREPWLLQCAGLDPDSGSAWVNALEAGDLVEVGPFGSVGTRSVGLGIDGDDVLEAWTERLTALAENG